MKILATVYKSQRRFIKSLTVFVTLFMLISSFGNKTMAQDKNQMVRLAKIKVDPLQLEQYNAALKEQMTQLFVLKRVF